MKDEILKSLKIKGFDEELFKISITSGLSKDKCFRVDCHNILSECKYILLYIENINTILLWKRENIFEVCSVPKQKLFDALNQKENYIIKGVGYQNGKKQKVYISSVDNIAEIISQIDKKAI